MPFLLWWRKSARRRLEHRSALAEKELRTSKALLAEDRRAIVAPLKQADQRNHYSDIIRDALDVGYGRSTGARAARPGGGRG